MMPRSDHSDRDKRERIERLKQRLANADTARKMGDVLKGVLDLLADEL
jgi:hypothetical protein